MNLPSTKGKSSNGAFQPASYDSEEFGSRPNCGQDARGTGNPPSVRLYLVPLLLLLIVSGSFEAHAQKAKVIVDQDARGPASTDMQSVLMFAMAPQVEVLGVTLVSGDQWVKEETRRTLRALEIAGRSDIPVVPGAEFPLLNTREKSEAWERHWGEFGFKGAWTPRNYHAPDFVPELEEGNPTTKPADEHAVNFIVRMVRKYPGEVTLWAGGPLTNFALAVRMEPELPSLARELVLMGAGFNSERGNIHEFNARREFNWWWDPEAVRIVMSADWPKITITPHDVAATVLIEDPQEREGFDQQVRSRIAAAKTPLSDYLTRFSGGYGGYMWDEISVAAFLDPSVITRQKELYVNIDIDHGASYGQTIFLVKHQERSNPPRERNLPSWWKPAHVQFGVDIDKFYEIYIDLMTRPTTGR